MASSVASASAERNPLKKRLNSQTKYVLMKLCGDYIEQEVKKSKVSINIKKRIMKVTGTTEMPSDGRSILGVYRLSAWPIYRLPILLFLQYQ